MKSNFKILFLMVLMGIFAWVGCQTQIPTSALSALTNPAMVLNFESGLAVNPSLAEANRPGNLVQLPGTATTTGGAGVTVNSSLASPGAGNTPQCLYVSGSVSDPGNSSYPAIQLQIPMDLAGNQYYDASLFSGVKFYIKVMPDDNAGKRSFSIPIAQTQPPSGGGTCNSSAASNACYNDFFVSYNNTSGSWQQLTIPFSSFARGAYGAAVSPTTLSGTNLQQILKLQWAESNNNTFGNITVDFYVDEVQFF